MERSIYFVREMMDGISGVTAMHIADAWRITGMTRSTDRETIIIHRTIFVVH